MKSVINALEEIKEVLEEQTEAAKELPAVTSSDNGKVLKVSGGKWGKGTETTELPTVTADDNGKVLMVVDGAWAVASLPE